VPGGLFSFASNILGFLLWLKALEFLLNYPRCWLKYSASLVIAARILLLKWHCYHSATVCQLLHTTDYTACRFSHLISFLVCRSNSLLLRQANSTESLSLYRTFHAGLVRKNYRSWPDFCHHKPPSLVSSSTVILHLMFFVLLNSFRFLYSLLT
jgi:hypothetical protein